MRDSCHVIRNTFPGCPRPESQRFGREGPYPLDSPQSLSCPHIPQGHVSMFTPLLSTPLAILRIPGTKVAGCSPVGGVCVLCSSEGERAGRATFQPNGREVALEEMRRGRFLSPGSEGSEAVGTAPSEESQRPFPVLGGRGHCFLGASEGSHWETGNGPLPLSERSRPLQSQWQQTARCSLEQPCPPGPRIPLQSGTGGEGPRSPAESSQKGVTHLPPWSPESSL